MATEARGQEPISGTYRFAMGVSNPLIRRWGRLEAAGVELIPLSGPTLIVANHDSYWDPIAIGVAARERRQIRALAKDTLWNIKPLAPILNGMGQVPIKRGAGDAAALQLAIEHLRSGECIGVFPEGTSSRGRTLRARSGVGRLAEAVPEARIVCCAVRGTVALARFPDRPQVSVEFFEPREGQRMDGESPKDLSVRLLAEIRERAPIEISGRSRRVAKRRASLEAKEADGAGGRESA
jgi:1-acyl-sn-glycerol-3-phosphate acyltransferase